MRFSGMQCTLSLVFLITSKLLFAQNISPTSRTFPWQLSVAYCHMTNPLPEITPKSGFGIRFLRLFREQKNFQVLMGLAYHRNHFYMSRYRDSRSTSYKDIQFTATSFSIPLLLRVKYGNAIQVFAEAGPSLAITYVRGKGLRETYSPTGQRANDYEFDGGFGLYNNILLNGSAGISITRKNTNCLLSLGYHHALTNNQLPEKYRDFISINLGTTIRLKGLSK